MGWVHAVVDQQRVGCAAGLAVEVARHQHWNVSTGRNLLQALQQRVHLQQHPSLLRRRALLLRRWQCQAVLAGLHAQALAQYGCCSTQPGSLPATA